MKSIEWKKLGYFLDEKDYSNGNNYGPEVSEVANELSKKE
ncbi:hypothetical protein OVS_03870 [Mycoplasma ovis str. Michigan]|uniref:Uncharacterized protein n=1 Tax=Mycoplasma ovis str. Michigan TaxID=1415773 RepID=A0ABM5P2E4_9MOLU|nr:hypothetical protein OVS_03870 [Mycoplasma ovis str. Michigan]